MIVETERFTALLLAAVGLSHVLQPKGWQRFFQTLYAWGAPGAFTNGLLSLFPGALIVAFHGHLWSGWGTLVTVIGWGQLTKGVLHLASPAHSRRSMRLVKEHESAKFAYVGIVMLCLAALIYGASFRTL